jgi:acyl carrier protein
MSTHARQEIDTVEADRMYEAIMDILTNRERLLSLDSLAARKLIDAVKWTAMRRLPDEEWKALRQMAVAQLEDLYAGTGQGISSSDVNHVAVGILADRFWNLADPLIFSRQIPYIP